MQCTLKKNNNTQKGYILIELALVFIVLAISIAVAIPFYENYKNRNATIETERRIAIVARALSSYSQMRWRLPCPADPNDVNVQAGTGILGIERPACDAATDINFAHGIIPYRTIGIPEHYAKDAYGHFFTYIVSPAFAVDNRLTGAGAGDSVHRRLIHRVAGDDTDGNYALIPRAKFCAPLTPPASDLIVNEDGVNLYPNPLRIRTTTAIAGIPNNVPHTSIYREDAVTAAAVAIISHGENGYGAYVSSGGQLPRNTNIGSAEELTSNNNDDTNQVWTLSNISNISNNVNEYDDIVKFYTQDEIYALAGRESCENL